MTRYEEIQATKKMLDSRKTIRDLDYDIHDLRAVHKRIGTVIEEMEKQQEEEKLNSIVSMVKELGISIKPENLRELLDGAASTKRTTKKRPAKLAEFEVNGQVFTETAQGKASKPLQEAIDAYNEQHQSSKTKKNFRIRLLESAA